MAPSNILHFVLRGFFSQLFEIYELIINIKRMGIAFLGILNCIQVHVSLQIIFRFYMYKPIFQDQVVVYRL